MHNKLCSALNHLSLTPTNILLAIRTIATPALIYSLPATTIDEKYLNLISNKLANSVLPKLGYNKHFPRVLAFGPTRYGELNLPDLYHHQGASQVEMITNHLHQNTSLTTAIVQLCEAFQARTGRLGSCLMQTRACSYIQGSWITNLGKYMHSVKCTIESSQIGTIKQL
jgi:hypothetical protein